MTKSIPRANATVSAGMTSRLLRSVKRPGPKVPVSDNHSIRGFATAAADTATAIRNNQPETALEGRIDDYFRSERANTPEPSWGKAGERFFKANRPAMVTAIILINVERPRLKSIADDLLAIDGIAEVYSVAGPWDMVAIVRVKDHEQISDLVTERIGALQGIKNTETLIAFRTFSKKDLGLLWDIGVD